LSSIALYGVDGELCPILGASLIFWVIAGA